MSNQNNEYYKMTEALGYKVVNHNDLDFDRFKNFSDFMNNNFETVEKQREIRDRKINIKKWDNSLPSRWRGATLKKIKSKAIPIIEEKIKKYPQCCFFIKGLPNSGKTFISYAIIRRYIYMGWVSQAEVKIITENELISLSKKGFQGQQKFDELLNHKYKLYLFDGVGETNTEFYDQKELSLWEQLIDHIYSKQLIGIFTSTNSYSSFAEKLPDSTQSKLANILEDKIIVIPESRPSPKIDDYSEKEIKKLDSAVKEDADLKDFFDN